MMTVAVLTGITTAVASQPRIGIKTRNAIAGDFPVRTKCGATATK